MLDTNILLYAMHGRDAALIERLETFSVGELGISAVTLGELEHGWQSGHGDRLSAAPFLELVPVLPFDAGAATGFGRVMASLPRPKGEPTIGRSPVTRSPWRCRRRRPMAAASRMSKA